MWEWGWFKQAAGVSQDKKDLISASKLKITNAKVKIWCDGVRVSEAGVNRAGVSQDKQLGEVDYPDRKVKSYTKHFHRWTEIWFYIFLPVCWNVTILQPATYFHHNQSSQKGACLQKISHDDYSSLKSIHLGFFISVSKQAQNLVQRDALEILSNTLQYSAILCNTL